MAVPSTPENMTVSSANGQVWIFWDQVSTATTYKIKRSSDNVTYSVIESASPNPPGYLDTTPALGTQYWYQVAAHNTDGDSSYTTAQSIVATTSGEMTLGQLRTNARREADMVNSEFLTDLEWNFNINNSLFELYDLLIDVYEDYYFASPAYFTTTGSSAQQALPNGVLTFQDATGANFIAPPFYKLCGVDLGVSNSPTGWVSMKKFMFADRNKYFYPNTQSTIYGVFNMQYRLMGQYLQFIPLPSGNQPMRMWYIPRMTMLLKDTDITTQGISGWCEYVILDAAIKALLKEESDASALMTRKEALKRRIEAAANNRDQGQPDTISDTRGNGGWGQGGAIQGFGGGF